MFLLQGPKLLHVSVPHLCEEHHFLPLRCLNHHSFKNVCSESMSVIITPIFHTECSDKALRICLYSLSLDWFWQLHWSWHHVKAQVLTQPLQHPLWIKGINGGPIGTSVITLYQVSPTPSMLSIMSPFPSHLPSKSSSDQNTTLYWSSLGCKVMILKFLGMTRRS